jgi:hypothetical protein
LAADSVAVGWAEVARAVAMAAVGWEVETAGVMVVEARVGAEREEERAAVG